MENSKILYVSQEIEPYLPESPIALLSRRLSQGIMEGGKEIRTFMPRFGNVNERRNQLHEVIRLSGLNIIIDDTDHPLIIKVASIPAARMQIYFIDNDDFFSRKGVLTDAKTSLPYEDNDERAIFFARGVLETTKKLRWTPDLIHLHGWFTMMIPIFVKMYMQNDPFFSKAKIVISLYDEAIECKWEKVREKLWVEGIDEKQLAKTNISDYVSLMKKAIDLSDGVCISSPTATPELVDYARQSGKPILEYPGEENYVAAYNAFYDQVLEAK